MPVCKVASSSFIAFFDRVILTPDNEIVSTPQRIVTTQRRRDIYMTHGLGGKSQEFLDDFSKNRHEYFIFAFVRDPLSRLVSSYFELLKRLKHKNNERKGLPWAEIRDIATDNGKHELDFERFVDFVVNKEKDFTDYINYHWRPQHVILNKILNNPRIKSIFKDDELYDFIGHLENFDEDLKIVLNRTKIKYKEFPWLLKSPAYDYKNFYNDKVLNMAYGHYEKDFNLLGYEKQ